MDRILPYEEDRYEIINQLNSTHSCFLVKDKNTHRYYVQKEMEVYSADVFLYLKNHHINNTPVIIELYERDGSLVVIEEYISGVSLSEYIDKRGHLSHKESVKYILELCQIVKQFHMVKPPIIHRDIKPDNIMINDNGDLILLDMNAAKFVSEDSSRDTYLLGTYGYAAPEQFGFGKANVTSDIYAIGKVLNVMLTGDLNVATDDDLKTVIAKCTEIDPQNRYQSIDELMEAIEGEKVITDKNYNRLPGFRSNSKASTALGVFGYISFFMAVNWMTIDGITSEIGTLVYRIAYGFVFMSSFLICCNYRYFWDRIGTNKISNDVLRILVKFLFVLGYFSITLYLSSAIISIFIKE